MGANANTMRVSFSATWVRAKFSSPPARQLQTNTMAVHGAAASRISRPMARSISLAGSPGRNRCARSTHPSRAIENGLITQLMNGVTPIPRQCVRTPASQSALN